MTEVLCYTRLQGKDEDPPVWVAVIQGCAADNGDGVVLFSAGGFMAADAFTFGSDADMKMPCDVEGKRLANIRQTYALEDVPQHVAAQWMKFKHKGII